MDFKAGLLALACALSLGNPALAQEARYRFSEPSEVRYTVKHPLHVVVGVSRRLEGSLGVEDGELVLPARLSVPLLGFRSGNRNRDQNALEALGALRFPEATLLIERVSWSRRGTEGDRRTAEGEAHGQLSLRGVTRPVRVSLSGSLGERDLKVTGGFRVRLSEFGIPAPSLMFVPVEDEVEVVVAGVAVREGESR